MRRRVMQLLFTLGLLLTLAAGTLWVRTIWMTDAFVLARNWVEPADRVMSQAIRLDCDRLRFRVSWWVIATHPSISVQAIPRDAAPWQFYHHTSNPHSFRSRSRSWWERIGFYGSTSDFGGMIVVPSWLVVLLPAALTTPVALWLYRDRARRIRKSKGLCPTCGYDLRATPERCPECGGTVPAKVQVAV